MKEQFNEIFVLKRMDYVLNDRIKLDHLHTGGPLYKIKRNKTELSMDNLILDNPGNTLPLSQHYNLRSQ